jgi:putative transposase
VSEFLGKQLEAASPDLLREMVRTFAEALMSADADNVCNAAYGERSAERVNSRNGYRDRPWDTRVGSIEVRVPKLRTGSYFPDWLLGRRTRAEQALISVVATAYLLGVSTRRVEGLVQTLGIEKLSRSQVSDMAKHLDAEVQAWRSRPLDAGPYTYLWIDALVVKVREDGRTQNVSVMLATAVNSGGQREILGLEVDTAETGAGWLAFLRSLVGRGLTGVQLAISDAHGGLTSALAAALPGASRQRCRTHFAANLLSKVPRSAQPVAAGLLRSVFDQPDPEQVQAQFDRVEAQLRDPLPRGRGLPRRRQGRPAGLQRLPRRALDQDPQQQPARAAQQGDPPAHRRRRDLPRPQQRDPPHRRGPGRTARRVVRRPPLPVRREPGQGPRQSRHHHNPAGNDRAHEHDRERGASPARSKPDSPRWRSRTTAIIHHL